MRCPRCQTGCSDGRCPQCGFEKDLDAASPALKGLSEAEQRALSSPLNQGAVDQPPEPDLSDWRTQIKHKLEEHNRKKTGQKRASKPSPRRRQSPAAVQDRPLFEYRLTEPEAEETRRKVVRFTKSGGQSQLAEKPLIRNLVSAAASVRSRPPKQQALSLEAAMDLSPLPDSVKESAPEPEKQISNEIILSRFLAGIIDLLFPLLVASLFLASGAAVAGFELFSPQSLRLGLGLALFLFFFNSFFFLILSGQTPGMYVTDLRLVGEDSETISLRSLAIRVFAFLPVAATVAGLIWSIPDPLCRCAHDRLSRTRVIPGLQPDESGRPTSLRN